MDFTSIILAVAIVGGAGLLIGLLLGLAGKKFHVEVDEREVAILNCREITAVDVDMQVALVLQPLS